MNNIPLIFVHNGNPSYLKHVFAHTHAFNKNADIYLLGDEENSNQHYVKHHHMAAYSGSANEFKRIYKHMSSTSYEFELFCFQRWFIINEFIKEQEFEHFLCLDSDVLLFCNVREVFSHFLEFDFTISQGHSPHITLFNKQSLGHFCDYLSELYTRPDYIERLKTSYNVFKDEHRPGGICDMFAFSLYPGDISNNIKDISDESDLFYFDSNLNESDGFEMKNNLKKIYWRNNLPFAKITGNGLLVRLYGLHFQGGAKSKIYKYVVNENLKRPGIVSSVKSFLTRKNQLLLR